MPPESPHTDRQKCPKCGSHFSVDQVFCKNCGTKLPISSLEIQSLKTQPTIVPQEILCPRCHTLITNLNSPFCPKCLLRIDKIVDKANLNPISPDVVENLGSYVVSYRKYQWKDLIFIYKKGQQLTFFAKIVNKLCDNANEQYIHGNSSEAKRLLLEAEHKIELLKIFDEKIRQWKKAGYDTSILENYDERVDPDFIHLRFNDYEKRVSRMEKMGRDFKSTLNTYPQLIEQPEYERIVISIKHNLKNPARIDAIEKDLEQLNEALHQHLRITELKEKSHKLLAETELLVRVPASLKTDLQAHEETQLERAFEELESLREKTKPVLAFTFEHTDLIANRWHKIGVPISNTGISDAFDVTLKFSKEFEVKRVQPITIAAGKTGTIELGILPERYGKIPFEITIEYRDAIRTQFKETQEFWIDVAEKGATTFPQSETPSSPVSQFTPKPLTLKQLPPDLLDRYTESEFIGKGGFARVFKAKRKDGKFVAVKIPISMDAVTGKSFIAEMQNWTKLSHPNIVRLFDYNIMPMPYFEEELCDSALADQNKPIESEEAAWILFNICEGLKFAHDRKIIHRDLKPQNILLKDGVPKISDWGLSRIISESTTTSATSFTPYYAAPEQINNRVKDERTDIWQLGIILYELVTGTLPFKGDSMIEIGMNIATKDPKPPGEITPDAKVIDAVVMKCLEKDPKKRYPSVLELQKDLAMYLRENYTELLKTSVSVQDYNRSAYYCGDLVMINLLTGDLATSYKYLLDLMHYSKGDVKAEAQELSEQIKMRMEMGVTEIPDELIQKAEIIAHQVKIGSKRGDNNIQQTDKKTTISTPRQGEIAGICPKCGSKLVWRVAQKTGELYRGCDNFDGGCRYQERSY